jgi:hypothetical protein
MASLKPYNPIIQVFSAATVAGSGAVNRWTYTVPAGKRTEVCHMLVDVDDNANAINTTVASIFAIIGGTTGIVMRLQDDGVRILAATAGASFWLDEGEQLIGQSTNNGAANVNMRIVAVLKEWG